MSSKTPWTDGPWHIKRGNATGFKTHSGEPAIYANARPTDDFFILQIAEMSTNTPEGERLANARLIAAAPEMAEALRLWAQYDSLDIDMQNDLFVVKYEEARAATLALLSRIEGDQG